MQTINPFVRSLTIAAMLVGPGLGCALDIDRMVADPAQYNYHSCKQLQQNLTALEKRVAELQLLRDRASKGTTGTVVGTIAYGADLSNARGQMKVIEDVAREKECDPPIRATSAAPVE